MITTQNLIPEYSRPSFGADRRSISAIDEKGAQHNCNFTIEEVQ